MDKASALKFLELLGYPDPNESRYPWLGVSCPLAKWRHDGGTDRNPSFGIMVNDIKPSHGHCFSCNWSGGLLDVVLTLRPHDRKAHPYAELRKWPNKTLKGPLVTPSPRPETLHEPPKVSPHPFPEGLILNREMTR